MGALIQLWDFLGKPWYSFPIWQPTQNTHTVQTVWKEEPDESVTTIQTNQYLHTQNPKFNVKISDLPVSADHTCWGVLYETILTWSFRCCTSSLNSFFVQLHSAYISISLVSLFDLRDSMCAKFTCFSFKHNAHKNFSFLLHSIRNYTNIIKEYYLSTKWWVAHWPERASVLSPESQLHSSERKSLPASQGHKWISVLLCQVFHLSD